MESQSMSTIIINGIKAYKYRLYPTKMQAKVIDEWLLSGKFIWNRTLRYHKMVYERYGRKTSPNYNVDIYYALRKQINSKVATRLAKKNAYWNAMYSDSRFDICARIEKAYQAAYKRLQKGATVEDAGLPRYKGRRHAAPSLYLRKLQIVEDTNPRFARLQLKNVGSVRFRLHRPLPDSAVVKSYMLSKDTVGDYWISVQFEYTHEAPEPSGPIVGIDQNINENNVLALSDGGFVPNPQYLDKSLALLRRLQRKLDRQRRANNPQNYTDKGVCKKGVLQWVVSSNQAQTQAKITELHRLIDRQRKQFWNEVTFKLCEYYGGFVLEDLQLAFMLKNKNLSRRATDVALGEFRRQLTYKAQERGIEIVFVNPAYTSQTCSRCGCVSKENRKTQADFRCIECGLEMNADTNAALNILRKVL